MAEPSTKRKLGELSEMIQGTLFGDPERLIAGIAPFASASKDQITFAADAKYLRRLDDCHAGAVIVPLKTNPAEVDLIKVANPQLAFAQLLAYFHPVRRPASGINSHAHIGREFQHGEALFIGPFVTIGDRVQVGRRVALHANVVLGDDVVLGDEVTIHPNVTILDRCRLGNRVTVHSGTTIGSDGFGYAPDGDLYYKIRHLGFVQIDDDVEIGANCAIDRATFGKTWIQRGAKIDNLVQVAHNVVVGEDTVLVAQVGISGSVTIGRHAILAGQAGISGHLSIGDHAIVGPQAGLAKSVDPHQVVSGSAAMEHATWLRVQKIVPTLPELKKKVLDMEKRLARLEGQVRKPTSDKG